MDVFTREINKVIEPGKPIIDDIVCPPGSFPETVALTCRCAVPPPVELDGKVRNLITGEDEPVQVIKTHTKEIGWWGWKYIWPSRRLWQVTFWLAPPTKIRPDIAFPDGPLFEDEE